MGRTVLMLLYLVLLPLALWGGFRFATRYFSKRALTRPPGEVGAPGRLAPALLVSAVLMPLITVLVTLSDPRVRGAAFAFGALAQITAWVMHAVPGHSRNLKYAALLFGAAAMAGALTGERRNDTALLISLVASAVHLVAAVGCVVLFKPDAPLSPGDVSSERALRAHRFATFLQGPDFLSTLCWVLASFLSLGVIFLYVRWATKGRVARRAVVYLRSFHYEGAAQVFGQVVTPAIHRSVAVTGLVHLKQPSEALQKDVPVLWRSHFATIADAHWQSWVEHHVKHALAVIIDASVTTGSVEWELEQVRRWLPAERVLIMHEAGATAPATTGTAVLSYAVSTRAEVARVRQEVSQWLSHALTSFDPALSLPPLVSAPRYQFPVLAMLVMGFGLPLSATIAAASAVGAQLGQAKVDLAKLDLHTISSAAQVAYASTGRCVALEELSPRYLSRAPLDPWGHAPRLSCPGFEVRSAGPDGVFDTEDDVVSK